MKNFLKLVFALILSLNIQCKAQSLDTLNYLKQFEANKANYIGQPFSKLLNDMTRIQPKTAWVYPLKNKRSMIKSTMFNFCEKEYSYGKTVRLHVIWQNEIPTIQAEALSDQNQDYFTNDERTFYGSKIVRDIMVYRH